MSEKNSNDSNDLRDRAASEDAVVREEIDSGKETETRAAAGTESAGRKKLPQLPPRARRFCAFLVGVVFFMSGTLKLMDPVGAGLIMEEYFKFFHVGFLSFAAKSSGTLLAFIETMSGVALITGVWRRFTACVVSVFMAIFTLLTLLLLIFNPAMDCGCFGEAVHLTHAQSFLKNVVIDVLIFAAFWPFKSFGRNKRRKYVAFSLVSVAVVALMLYSLLYIPLIDFTDFKPGVRLAAADVRSHAEGDDAYEAVFIYEKDGEREAFTLDNLPDSTWTYVSTETRSRNASADELMPALSFSDASGEYHDELAAHKDVMIVSMFRPSDTDAAKWCRTAAFVNDALDNGFFPLVIVSGTTESVLADFSEYENKYPSELSAGMARRVAILRAFLFDSPVILMDEPFINLDPALKYSIMDMFLDMQRHTGRTAVSVTHDVNEAIYIADRIIVISGGRVVYDNPEVTEADEKKILAVLLKTGKTS